MGTGGVARGQRRWVVGPLALAVFQVVGTVGASQRQPAERGLDVLAVLLALAGPLALLAVRRAPVAVLGFTGVVVTVYLARGYAYGPVFASLAVATVVTVVLGHRRAAWAMIGAVFAAHLAVRAWLRDDPWSWPAALGVAAWALLVLALAEVVRVRRERAVEARRGRAEADRRQADEERLRIARELHDVVAHHMSLINVQAGVALHLVDRTPEQARTALAAIKDASHEALGELRSLIRVLRDDEEALPLAPAAVLTSLGDLVARSRHAGLDVERVVEGDARPLTAAVELAAVRIVQEAVTNVVRHSSGSRVRVLLAYGDRVLRVRVDDDGTTTGGVSVLSGVRAGAGIRGMRERASALGGSLEIASSASGGLSVRAVLPLGGSSGNPSGGAA